MSNRKIYISSIFLLILLCTSSYAQNVNNKNRIDPYRDFYKWQEPEKDFPNSDSVLTVLGRWAWGPCLAVDADSNFAYIGNGPTFQVLDISDPSKPEIVGEYLTDGYIYDLEVRSSVAFVSIGSGLLIIDISNPKLPEKISEISIGGVAISLALDDTFVYVSTFSGIMWVVDVSDLSNPVKRSGIPAGGERAYCIESKDGYVYVGSPEYPPVLIVDANNPDTLTTVDFDVGGLAYSANIKDTLLFLGVHGYDVTNYLKIYSISNAAVPRFLGEAGIQAPEDIMAIMVSGDEKTAYIRTTSGNIYSVDITNPTLPEIIGKYEKSIGVNIENTGIVFTNNSILSAHYSGLLSLDVSRQDSLELESFFPTGGTALEMDSKNNLVFVACGLSGLWILNISNPISPQTVSNINTGGFTADVIVDDTLIYLVNWAAYSEHDTSRGLWIIDISNITQPQMISHYKGITKFSTTTEPNSIAKSANLIFITQQPRFGIDSILEITDVSDIYHPKSKGVFAAGYYPKYIAIKDSVLFLATRDAGLRMINIKNPSQPVEINVFNDSSDIGISDVNGDVLYVDKVDTFFVLDISYPSEPYILGSLRKSISGSSLNIETMKGYVYSKDGIIDVSDPTFPKELTSPSEFEYSYDIQAKDNLILLSNIYGGGVWILKNNLITSIIKDYTNQVSDFQLSQNYPNPLNSNTIIEFGVPKKEKVTIEIFNVLGQIVKILLNKEVETGKHKVEFNVTNLSSGIYFYKLSAGGSSITKKMVILK